VAFYADSPRVVSGGADATVRFWNVETSQPIGAPLRGHHDEITCVAVSPDGRRVVSASKDKTLRLWDGKTGESIGDPLEAHSDWVTSADFSPDGKRFVSGALDGTLHYWDAETGEAIGPPTRWKEDALTVSIMSVAFSPDGHRIVLSGFDLELEWGALRLWNADTGKETGAPMREHKNPVTSAAFSPSGLHLVSGSLDKTVRLWDATTGEPIGGPLSGHEGAVMSVAFSPDSARFVSGSHDNTLRLWPAPKVWPKELCKKLVRNMSRQEWRDWVSPEIPYTCQCSDLPIPADDGTISQSSAVCEVNE
jgi:WD40 repeat protein